MANSILNFIALGGIVMIPLLLVIFAAFFIIFERYFTLRKFHAEIPLISQTLNSFSQKNLEPALILIKNKQGPIALLLKEGLTHFNSTEEIMLSALKKSFYQNAHYLQKNLTTLQVLGALLPMLGLLGTINGMVHLFHGISLLGLGDSQSLAKGISEALITTETGLAGAIPVIFLHNYLSTQAENILVELKKIILTFQHTKHVQ